jgi:pimeloyl-ACP methyl ester carboxylesterase
MNLPTEGAAGFDGSSTFIEHRVQRAEGNLYVRDYPGQAPAFVLMHGFPDNLHIYDDLVPHLLAGGRRVVAFDFLGFGKSDKLAGATYSFQQQVGDLLAVVQGLELGKVVPVAHDSSGPAAVNFALDYPQHVSALCILNALYGDAPTLKLPEFIEMFATPSLSALSGAILRSPEQFAWVLNFQRSKFQEHLPEEQKAHYASFLGPLIDNNFRQVPSAGPAFGQMTAQLLAEVDRNTRRLEQVKALDIPVILIWGETDPYLNTGVAMDLQSAFKTATLHVLHAGHWVQIDAAEKVADLMLAAV